MRSNLSWGQLTGLKVGGAICLPVIMAGHALCQNYGLVSALVAIFMGNAILLIMALAMAKMSYESGMTTTDNASAFFGTLGTRCFSMALVIVKTSWIAIQLGLMALSFKTLLPETIPLSVLQVFLGALVIAVSMRGISLLSKITTLSLPLLLITLAYAIYSTRHVEPPFREIPFTLEGISLAMATAITAVIDMPTYFRHAKTKRDGVLAAALFIGVSVPLIEGIGIYLCYKHPGLTVIDTLNQSQNQLWNLWVTVFIVLAGWSTNNSNLYSAAAGLGTLVPQFPEKKRVVLIGCIGIILSLCGILQSFVFALQILGVMVSSMGCVIVTRYMLKFRGSGKINLMTWGLGAIVGLASACKIITITGVPLIDGCAVSVLATALNHLIQPIPEGEKI